MFNLVALTFALLVTFTVNVTSSPTLIFPSTSAVLLIVKLNGITSNHTVALLLS